MFPYTVAERAVLKNFHEYLDSWKMYSLERLTEIGIEVDYLLKYQSGQGMVVPLFQFKRSGDRVVPDLVVQNANRILSARRTPKQIAVWWCAYHPLLSKLAAQDTTPRMALANDMSQLIVAAALFSADTLHQAAPAA